VPDSNDDDDDDNNNNNNNRIDANQETDIGVSIF
jgi:hypothetical protein